MISTIIILTKSVNLLMLASPIKDASDLIKTAFLLIRRLKYKLKLYSRVKHAPVVCVFIGGEARMLLYKRMFRLLLE